MYGCTIEIAFLFRFNSSSFVLINVFVDVLLVFLRINVLLFVLLNSFSNHRAKVGFRSDNVFLV